MHRIASLIAFGLEVRDVLLTHSWKNEIPDAAEYGEWHWHYRNGITHTAVSKIVLFLYDLCDIHWLAIGVNVLRLLNLLNDWGSTGRRY